MNFQISSEVKVRIGATSLTSESRMIYIVVWTAFLSPDFSAQQYSVSLTISR